MKNIITLFFFVALLNFSFVSQAQVCTISETNDNVVVQKVSLDKTNNVVDIQLSNDSKDISANIAVTIEVTYTYNGTHVTNNGNTQKKYFYGNILVIPGAGPGNIIHISIDPTLGSGFRPTNAKVISLEGKKCM